MEPGAVSPQRATAHEHPLAGHAAHMEKFLRPFRCVVCRQVGYLHCCLLAFWHLQDEQLTQ